MAGVNPHIAVSFVRQRCDKHHVICPRPDRHLRTGPRRADSVVRTPQKGFHLPSTADSCQDATDTDVRTWRPIHGRFFAIGLPVSDFCEELFKRDISTELVR